MEKEIKTIIIFMLLMCYLIVGTIITSTFCEAKIKASTETIPVLDSTKHP